MQAKTARPNQKGDLVFCKRSAGSNWLSNDRGFVGKKRTALRGFQILSLPMPRMPIVSHLRTSSGSELSKPPYLQPGTSPPFLEQRVLLLEILPCCPRKPGLRSCSRDHKVRGDYGAFCTKHSFGQLPSAL